MSDINQPSHIVIDAREYTTSTGRYMFRLVQYLERIENETGTGHTYTILLKPRDMDVYAFTNPRFTKVVCPYKEFTFGEQIGLLRQLRSLHPDLVHFGMVQQPILYTGRVVTTMQDLTTIRFRNPAKNPIVFTAKQQVYKLVNQVAARKSVAIITPTEFVKRDVCQYTGVSADKITATHEAADAITEAPEALPNLVGKQFIMYIGRPTPHKNLERLIDSFDLLKQTYPTLQLVLCGKKDTLYEQHEAYVRQKGIQDVVFTGFVSEGQLRWLYENCQAYVFPSLSEGFGLPGLEAMTHGAPVVSSNATCLPEVYGGAAQYFNPLSVGDMTTQISNVLGNEQLRHDLIQKGRAQAASYSWRRMAEQTLAVYQSALLK